MQGPKPRDPAERFWEKVDKSGECWIWTGAKIPQGYGVLLVGSRSDNTRRYVRAHRFVYELEVGNIPKGMLFCHHCDIPSCVNPAHLFVGTPADNMKDKMLKGRCKNQWSK